MKGYGQYNGDLKKEKKLVNVPNCNSDQSSSIGIPSDDGDSDIEGEVQSSVRNGVDTPLDSLASLEASLPIKKGISLHYEGKSKSFSNLAAQEVGEAKDLGKKEHLVNKKRRLIVSHKWGNSNPKRASTSQESPTMPVFPSEDGEHEDISNERNKKHGKDGTSRIF